MEDTMFAMLLCVASLVLLGCWLSSWKYLHMQQRNPTHVFIDYGVGILLMGTLPTIITGNMPDRDGKPPFFEQLQEPIYKLAAFALAGGVLLGGADFCTTITVQKIGLVLGPAINSSTSLAFSIVMNYLLDRGLNKAVLVFSGMGVAMVAVGLAATTQANYTRDVRRNELKKALDGVAEDEEASNEQDAEVREPLLKRDEAEGTAHAEARATAATSHATRKKDAFIGVSSAVLAGLMVSCFVPAINIASNDPFHLLPPGLKPLSIWTANFFINLSLALTCLIFGTLMLYWPQWGSPVSSLTNYLADSKGRAMAIFSGCLNASGNVCQFFGGQYAGFAAATMAQTFPVVTTLIGLLVWKEFRGASRTTALLLCVQIATYFAAAGILGSSFRRRE